MRLVTASGPNNFNFAVIDFTAPATPIVSHAIPTFGGSCTLDTNEELVAVGNMNGGQIEFYDLSDPSAPVRLGNVATGLLGIGTLSFDDTRVLAGELNGLRAALIDVADPSAPNLVSVINTGIASIASIILSGTHAIAAGPNDDTIDIFNYTNPAAPTRASFFPNLNGPLVADLDGTRAAVGDQGGSSVALVDIVSRTVLGVADTTLASISSISIDGNRVVASSTNEIKIAIIDFSTPTSPTVKLFNPGTGGGCTIVQSGGLLATGAVLGNAVGLVSLAGATPAVIATAKSAISSISSLALSDFTPPSLPGKILASANKLTFGEIPVCQSQKQTISLKNVGKGKLAISSIVTTGPYSAAPTTAVTLVPNAGLTLSVTFTPTAVGPAPGVLRVTSDDPSVPLLVIPITGTALPTPPPEIDVHPSPMLFGASLPKYFFGKRIVIANKSPCLSLTVTALATGNAVFPVTAQASPTIVPTTLAIPGAVIPPSGSRTFIVVFAPPAVGTYNGVLQITSNDPKHPSIAVPLSGVCVLPKPTAACLVLDHGHFMAFDVQGIDRMDLLKSAVRLFVELMPEEQGDFLGSVIFQYVARRFTAMLPSNRATKEALLLKLPMLAAGYGNSVEDGIDVAMLELENDLDELDTPVVPVRRVMLILTAGGPIGTSNLDKNIPMVVATGVEVYTVAMGLGTYAVPERLSQLAVSSKGKFFASDDPLLLRKNFVQVLADAFRMNLAFDPIDTVNRGETRDVPMHVTKCERRLKFVCTWHELSEHLSLELTAPDGTRFIPATPATNPLVHYATQPGSAFFDLLLPPLDDNDVIGPQVLGVWTLKVLATNLVADSVRFTTALLVESPLKLKTIFETTAILEPSRVHFHLLEGSQPIPNAQIAVTLLAPRSSSQVNRVRELAITRNRSRDDPSGASVTVDQAIDEALDPVVRQPRPGDPDHASVLPMQNDFSARASREMNLPQIDVERFELAAQPTIDFRYAVRLPPSVIDGIYQIIVQARAPACDGILTRYGEYAFSPRQIFDPGLSDYAISRVPQPGEPVEFVLTPRDRAGNLLGPSRGDSITVGVGNGAAIAAMADRLDGSYLVRIARLQPAALAVSLRIGDVTHTVMLPKRLYWMYLTQPFQRWWSWLIARWRVWLALRRWRRDE
jgi:Abnormal spindle-like microcephaly-assoc'd, ASPM-SPD-2-Hydin